MNVWSTVPSNWSALPCSSTMDAGSAAPGPALLCPEGLYSVSNAALWSLQLDKSLQQFADFSTDVPLPPFYVLANSSAALAIQCAAPPPAPCTLSPLVQDVQGLGSLAAAHMYPSLTQGAGWWTLWLAGSTGLVAYDVSISSPAVLLLSLPGVQGQRVAAAPPTAAGARRVAVSNSSTVMLFRADSLALSYVHWVTNVSQGWGGVFDDVPTAMAWDGESLWVGNPTALNVMYPNGTVQRFGPLEGLCMNNITSLSVDVTGPSAGRGAGTRRLWIGTTAGVVLFDPLAPPSTATVAPTTIQPDGASLSVSPSQRWRYLSGPRWLPASPQDTMASNVTRVLQGGDGSTLVISSTGLSILHSQSWTLAQKASYMESTTPLTVLYGTGLTTSCSASAFGAYTPPTGQCTPDTDDNSGLWTSLHVVAQSMKFAVTGDTAAATQAAYHLHGLRLLNEVTGIHGLFARCCLPPGHTPPAASSPILPVLGSAPIDSLAWHNSTALPGWTWEGDTSSDEVAGHVMAYTVAASLLAQVNATAAGVASSLLVNLTRYVVLNNYTLVDVTGLPTTWGQWQPSKLNFDQSWSDTRGLNSLEMLAMLQTALQYVQPGSADALLFQSAYDSLTQVHGYNDNLLNTKITAPCDDNYSDDELEWFSHFALLWAAKGNAAVSAPVFAAMQRSLRIVEPTRPALWIAMAAGLTGDSSDTEGLGHIAWFLRTYPLEQLDWPTVNSGRLDIVFDPEVDRDYRSHVQSITVLPPNERAQYRWNGDPRDLDGGSGYSVTDPGAFLLPYWMARYYTLLAASTTTEG